MNFSSDTSAPAHPAVLEALARVNSGAQPSYGDDDVMSRLRDILARVFETQAFEFWITASGTASNALALSCFCPPHGAILCHQEAHIERDERGAPEFFTGGGKLRLLPGAGARIDPEALAAALAANDPGFVHETPLSVLSLTNLTECGTAYHTDEIEAFASRAKTAGLVTHLDGARLANALVHTGASPAGMSWRAGIDVVTLGLTKTGAMGCEIILLFGAAREKASELRIRAKRSGHMPPKMRYLAAQAEAMLADGLWLQLAAEANRKAAFLAQLFADAGAPLLHPREGNEIFVALSGEQAASLRAAGVRFYPWPGGGYRFVCSWVTAEADITGLKAALASAR